MNNTHYYILKSKHQRGGENPNQKKNSDGLNILMNTPSSDLMRPNPKGNFSEKGTLGKRRPSKGLPTDFFLRPSELEMHGKGLLPSSPLPDEKEALRKKAEGEKLRKRTFSGECKEKTAFANLFGAPLEKGIGMKGVGGAI